MATPNSIPPTTPGQITHEVAAKWFDPNVTVPPQARDLLESYSHIPPVEVENHIITLRNKAWALWPYPCLGQFRFLELNLSARDLYPSLLNRLRAGGTFLDVGCCLGQDIRKLVHDGVPSENLAGIELEGGFIDLGYELFRDRDRIQAKFVQGNVLEDGGVVEEFEGRFDVVQLGMILHLFTWEEQVRAFEHAIRMLKKDGEGMVIGQAVGHLDELSMPSWGKKETFRHNEASFRRLVSDVEAKTGTKWDVDVTLDEGLSIFDGKRFWDDPKTRRLLFKTTRVKQER